MCPIHRRFRPLILAAFAAAGVARADPPPTVNVHANADSRAVVHGMLDIGLRIIPPCLQARGASKPADQQACFCANQPAIEVDLASVDAVLARHADWKGAVLHVVDGDNTLDLKMASVTHMKGMLAKCPPAKPAKKPAEKP